MQVKSMFIAASILSIAALEGCSNSTYKPEKEEDLFFQAQKAISEGNKDEAIRCLSKSLETKPTSYAYYLRAKLLEEKGEVDKAIADCEAGLNVDPENRDIKWLLAECRKPGGKRFQGKNANPPSFSK